MHLKLELLKLQSIMGNKKTSELIADYCSKNKDVCKRNKEYICKHILKVYGYETHGKYKFCYIFKELLEFAKKTENFSVNFIGISDDLLLQIRKYGSNELLKFIKNNNIEITPIPKALTPLVPTNVSSNPLSFLNGEKSTEYNSSSFI